MKYCFTALSCLAAVLSVLSCNKSSPEKSEYPGMIEVQYEENTSKFLNPERGFYSPTGCSSADPHTITSNLVKVVRSEYRSLLLFEYWLKDFLESDISDDFLNVIKANFEATRKGGAKCLLRFGYNEADPTIDPEAAKPYDTKKEYILRHIEQLKPIIQENADVILQVQAGFIGSWGEWYYTENFPSNPSTPEDYAPWKEVVDALLKAVPESRQIAIRTPSFKMNMFGWALADTLTRAEAHGTTDKARLGGHNDCFLVDYSDRGTFKSADDRAYWAAESKYVIMGGESCGLSSFCSCDNSLEQLKKFHYTYLNSSYDPQVIKRWSNENCFEDVRARLGYRLLLTKGFFDKDPAAGMPYRLVLKIRNDGFAPPMNPRDALLVLSDVSGKVLETYPLDSDPRYWMPEVTQVLDRTIQLPADAAGKLTLSLWLPDPEVKLRERSEYAIRLANKDVWDETHGYNVLTTIEL